MSDTDDQEGTVDEPVDEPDDDDGKPPLERDPLGGI